MEGTSSVAQWDSLHLELETQLGITHMTLVFTDTQGVRYTRVNDFH